MINRTSFLPFLDPLIQRDTAERRKVYNILLAEFQAGRAVTELILSSTTLQPTNSDESEWLAEHLTQRHFGFHSTITLYDGRMIAICH